MATKEKFSAWFGAPLKGLSSEMDLGIKVASVSIKKLINAEA